MSNWWEEFGAPTHNPEAYRGWADSRKREETRKRLARRTLEILTDEICSTLFRSIIQFNVGLKSVKIEPGGEACATIFMDSGKNYLTGLQTGKRGKCRPLEAPEGSTSFGTIHTHPDHTDDKISFEDALWALAHRHKGMCIVHDQRHRHCYKLDVESVYDNDKMTVDEKVNHIKNTAKRCGGG